MVKQTIRIYCRIKPTKHQTGIYEVDSDENECPKLAFNVPRDLADGFVNNKREVYSFRFDHIFDQKTKQDEVFDIVAKPTIDSVLSGYNGTMFAYGQTGSGKTFTITGGAERYVDRGIIPRMLSYVFEQYENTSTHVYTTHISYLEIYNENGYDLLDPKHEASKLEDLPKVTLMEDNDGNIHLKNLSLHSANNEEDALNLLFLGDTNRMIAETPMNQASTRSHCIFTVHITARESGSATIRRSKLHLVDLAGSERIGKTGVGGVLLTEAKYINLSLHYLEQVIIALSEKSRSHIPYRNSMMTSVLRDSLGGNCMTSMIATCSVEKKNIDESISTCRFAQRVSLIKNDALLNEEIDPKLMIAKLKREIQGLKDELSLATGQVYEGELTSEEKERLRTLVASYVADNDSEATLAVGADMRKINFCFFVLKEFTSGREIRSGNSSRADASTIQANSTVTEEETGYLADKNETQKLKELIKQRDNEINILVSMLKKEKLNAKSAENRSLSLPPSRNEKLQSNGESSSPLATTTEESLARNSIRQPEVSEIRPKSGRQSRNALLESLSNKQKGMSAGRQEAFEHFRRDYEENRVIEENKKLLKQKYSEAKGLGEEVNKSRQLINSTKTKLEQNRMRRSIQENVTGSMEDCTQLDEEESNLRVTLDQEKARYRTAFTMLKNLKTEIEHLQHLLEKSKVKLQKDFEFWWAEQTTRVTEEKSEKNRTKAAWRTPPASPAEVGGHQGITGDEQSRIKDMERQARRIPSIPDAASNSSNRNRQKGLPYGILSDNKRPLRHEQTGNQSGSIALKLRSEVNSISSNSLRSSTASATSLESQDSQSVEEMWKSTNSAISQGSVGSQSFQLTGDSQADADILAFMKARQTLLKNKSANKK